MDRLRIELRDERQSRMQHESNAARHLADLEETRTKKEGLQAVN